MEKKVIVRAFVNVEIKQVVIFRFYYTIVIYATEDQRVGSNSYSRIRITGSKLSSLHCF